MPDLECTAVIAVSQPFQHQLTAPDALHIRRANLIEFKRHSHLQPSPENLTKSIKPHVFQFRISQESDQKH
jgi:hypothetical protein